MAIGSIIVGGKTVLDTADKVLPDLKRAFGENKKKILKDDIKRQMLNLGVKESAIMGFSWRNANAGADLLRFLKGDPEAVSAYNANPIKDIGGDSVKKWIANYLSNAEPRKTTGGGAPLNISTAKLAGGGSMVGYVVTALVLVGILFRKQIFN